jgi:hypothetical protein
MIGNHPSPRPARSELEDDRDFLVQADPDLLVLLRTERHDRLADRPLDPKTSVTTRDGDLDPSPFPAGFFDRRSDASFQPRHRTAILAADSVDGERAEQEMLFDLAQEVFHHEVNPLRISGRDDDMKPMSGKVPKTESREGGDPFRVRDVDAIRPPAR